MGGGHWNGKNHGGEHTGIGKKLKCGPYTANGYRPEPDISHKDFFVGSDVIYTGTNKNKSQYYIPNGSKGKIMKKDNSNKLKKVSRSFFKVNFESKGIHYVHKNVLQLANSFKEHQEYILNFNSEGLQNYRNDKKKEVNEKLNKHKYKNIIDNRNKIKKFREWRKEFLDEKKLEIQSKINELLSNPEYKQKRETKKKLMEEIDYIQDMYSLTNEPVTKINYLTEHKDEFDDPDMCLKQYHYKKDKDLNKLKYLKNELEKVKYYFDNSSNEIKKLNEIMDRGNKQFIYQVNSKEDYNNFLHHHYNEKNKGVKYKYEPKKPSREYKVDNTIIPKIPDNINLLLWGLYPRDVH